MNDTPHWLDKTLTTIKKAGEAARDGVQQAYHVGTLKLDIASLRRSLDDVVRDVGRTAVDAIREKGTLSADQVAPLLRRVDDLEDQIAEKERRIADLERESPETPEPPPEETISTGRKRPNFTSTGGAGPTG